MGTRAVYTFIDDDSERHVYKHYDGIPAWALRFIERAIPYSWLGEDPRFEAADFAAAFIAANKNEGGGDVQLTDGYATIGDLDYRYEIRFDKDRKDLLVTGFLREWGARDPVYKEIFEDTLSKLKANPEIGQL